jgi:preprotein translocase subunit SecF
MSNKLSVIFVVLIICLLYGCTSNDFNLGIDNSTNSNAQYSESFEKMNDITEKEIIYRFYETFW